MASAVLQSAARRLPGVLAVASTVTRFERRGADFTAVTVDVADHERPPFASLDSALSRT
jgi:hypothetical protein